MISQEDYGMLNSDKVLKKALLAMQENKEKKNESIDDI